MAARLNSGAAAPVRLRRRFLNLGSCHVDSKVWENSRPKNLSEGPDSIDSMDLFDAMGTDDAGIPDGAGGPLAARMRPRTLDEVVGQGHLLAEGSPLRRLAEASGGAPSSVFLWGPPGTGLSLIHI